MIDPDVGDIKQFLEQHDTRAFGRLMGKYKDRVYNYCYAYFGNSHDADDNTQEIFIRVYEKLGSFQFKSQFSSWLYRIMINHCNNTYKSKAYKIRRQMNHIEDREVRNGRKDPESAVISKELEGIIYRAIDLLKGKQKTILILRDIDGRSYEEIAEITGLNMGTVKSNLARARGKVATALKNQHIR
jgi:RNA polymerase sigma-70 factor (ECF subfamily)